MSQSQSESTTISQTSELHSQSTTCSSQTTMTDSQPASQIPANSGKDYIITSSGTNTQGNHYCVRDYTPSTGGDQANFNTYHYSNTNGSYYYSNPNGSTCYNDGQGLSHYTRSPGETYTNFGDGAYAYGHADGSKYYNDGDGFESYTPPTFHKEG